MTIMHDATLARTIRMPMSLLVMVSWRRGHFVKTNSKSVNFMLDYPKRFKMIHSREYRGYHHCCYRAMELLIRRREFIGDGCCECRLSRNLEYPWAPPTTCLRQQWKCGRNSFVPLFGVLSDQLAQQFPVPSSSTAATSTCSETQSEIDKVKIHRPSGEEFLA
jgi:hypothetical protein